MKEINKRTRKQNISWNYKEFLRKDINNKQIKRLLNCCQINSWLSGEMWIFSKTIHMRIVNFQIWCHKKDAKNQIHVTYNKLGSMLVKKRDIGHEQLAKRKIGFTGHMRLDMIRDKSKNIRKITGND